MALTLATELANYAAGIGTQGATLKIDSANKRVGVGTTNPQGPEGSLQVGTGITFFGNTGIISAIGGKFSGDFTVGGTLTYEDVQNVNSSGVGTFSGGINVVGGGLTVTGVSTFFSRVSIADSIVHTGDIDTSLRFPAANTFSVETGGTERLRVFSDASVRVGDNTIAVAAVGAGPTFAVNGAAPEITLRDSATDNPYAWMATNDNGSLILAADQGADANSSIISFNVDGSQRGRITGDGRLGINTDPGTLLELTGRSGEEAVVTFNREGVQGTPDGTIGRLIYENHTDSVASIDVLRGCLLYTSPSPRDLSTSRMPSSA